MAAALWIQIESLALSAIPLIIGIWLLLGGVMSRVGICQTWQRLLNREDVLILDTETTGLDHLAEVIDLAVIDTRGQVRMNVLILPQETGEIKRHAAEVHGLTRRKLIAEGAQQWPAVHEEFVALLDQAQVVLAYNAPFDSRLLEQSARRHGLSLPKKRWRCILNDYRALRAGRHCSLQRAVEREEVPAVPGKAHRALHDCRCVLGVMRVMVDRELGLIAALVPEPEPENK